MSLSEKEKYIKKKKREITEEKIRNMSDSNAYCPTCNQEGFKSIRRMLYHHNKKHMFEVRRTEICEYCENVFVPKNSENPNKYCDEICFGLAQKEETEHVTFTCKRDDCNSERTVYKNYYEKYNPEYCSVDCNMSGKENYFWNGGNNNIRQSKEYRNWRKEIHKQSEECEECSASNNLQAHHIVPISKNEELATDIENGKLLCGDCHSKKHENLAEELFK